MTQRNPLVVGNWKMNPDRAGAVALARAVAQAVAESDTGAGVGVCPAFVHLESVARVLGNGGATVRLGAQDVYPGDYGAFTGEVSVAMLRDVGVGMVLTGHSERRHVIGETDDLINRKTRAVLEAGLMCILCVGETLEQREAGETDHVNERQVRSALGGVDAAALANLVIAYEPVWAIGTGRTASPDDAQAAHARIRALLADIGGAQTAERTRILYGGSVKPDNAAELFSQPDIDGGLIGGASLKADAFLEIVRAAGRQR